MSEDNPPFTSSEEERQRPTSKKFKDSRPVWERVATDPVGQGQVQHGAYGQEGFRSAPQPSTGMPVPFGSMEQHQYQVQEQQTTRAGQWTLPQRQLHHPPIPQPLSPSTSPSVLFGTAPPPAPTTSWSAPVPSARTPFAGSGPDPHQPFHTCAHSLNEPRPTAPLTHIAPPRPSQHPQPALSFQHQHQQGLVRQQQQPPQIPQSSQQQQQRQMTGQRGGLPGASLPVPGQQQVMVAAKSHVVSACVNCKKAHLACDVNRPCKRCVSLGKADTCVDSTHKKRGRPRLKGTVSEQEVPRPYTGTRLGSQGGPNAVAIGAVAPFPPGFNVPPQYGVPQPTFAHPDQQNVTYMPPRTLAPQPSVTLDPYQQLPPTIVATWDLRCFRVHESVRMILGHEPGSIVDRNVLEMVYVQDRERFHAIVQRLLRQPTQQHFTDEFRYMDLNGHFVQLVTDVTVSFGPGNAGHGGEPFVSIALMPPRPMSSPGPSTARPPQFTTTQVPRQLPREHPFYGKHQQWDQPYVQQSVPVPPPSVPQPTFVQPPAPAYGHGRAMSGISPALQPTDPGFGVEPLMPAQARPAVEGWTRPTHATPMESTSGVWIPPYSVQPPPASSPALPAISPRALPEHRPDQPQPLSMGHAMLMDTSAVEHQRELGPGSEQIAEGSEGPLVVTEESESSNISGHIDEADVEQEGEESDARRTGMKVHDLLG
ncbi:hypothetical protein G7K_5093-t1 [Saitoella complicata NRRL Y-17804]|uniref:Zn(2)-C6 fungal-type domain-containing protein n=2 Tax=Saitoella complicata (strain BCRC 22490 / CBS 7301 / JCM 7358 / NBRC 10748 / NRRL Y-17804) TaxID=698492 RepID=A0A0E9NMF5_SAICN|nr:hypothetical protein G7K_5093-t1 [Saitoella complicata NRRL Y-17804]